MRFKKSYTSTLFVNSEYTENKKKIVKSTKNKISEK